MSVGWTLERSSRSSVGAGDGQRPLFASPAVVGSSPAQVLPRASSRVDSGGVRRRRGVREHVRRASTQRCLRSCHRWHCPFSVFLFFQVTNAPNRRTSSAWPTRMPPRSGSTTPSSASSRCAASRRNAPVSRPPPSSRGAFPFECPSVLFLSGVGTTVSPRDVWHCLRE